MKKTLALIAAGLSAGALFAQAPGTRPKTPPTTTTTTTLPAQPERVKVATEDAWLVESPEMLQNCRKAVSAEGEARDAWTARAAIADRFDLEMASKPRDKMTPKELELRELGEKTLLAFEKKYPWMEAGGVHWIAELAVKAKTVCADAITAKLTEGTVLTVLKRDGELLQVRVETGRATGKNGYIIAGSVKPE